MYYILPIDFATPEFDETIRLRHKILREPLGMEYTAQQLAAEYDSFHLAAYDEQSRLVGCLVLLPVDELTMKMRQVAVQESQQRKGVGAEMVAASEVFARRKGCTQMILHARDVAIPFYLKLGYKKIGRAFTEVGIKHYKMVKSLV